MIAPWLHSSETPDARMGSAVPRISKKRTSQGCLEAMSSMTNAALPLRDTLRNFWVDAMLNPRMSIAPRSALSHWFDLRRAVRLHGGEPAQLLALQVRGLGLRECHAVLPPVDVSGRCWSAGVCLDPNAPA